VIAIMTTALSITMTTTTTIKTVRMERILVHNQQVDDFYRQEQKNRIKSRKATGRIFSPRSFHPGNGVYVYYQQNDNATQAILAALRLTRKESKLGVHYIFLRSLVVSKDHRRQGWALRLLEEAMHNFCDCQQQQYSPEKNAPCYALYCFAPKRLQPLYVKAGLEMVVPMMMQDTCDDRIPTRIIQKYQAMAKRNPDENLQLFVEKQPLQPNIQNCSAIPRIVLLQSGEEQYRKTATGWLLQDKKWHQFSSFYKPRQEPPQLGQGDTDPKEVLDSRISLEEYQFTQNVWQWKGRQDNCKVEKLLLELSQTCTPILLWTEGAGLANYEEELPLMTKHKDSRAADQKNKAFIILDGTWQEAKSIYRKLPILWKLPRLSLKSSSSLSFVQSTYRLRKDFGWQQRVSSTAANKNVIPLCTVEVAALLLEQLYKNERASKILQNRLTIFQEQYPRIKWRGPQGENESEK